MIECSTLGLLEYSQTIQLGQLQLVDQLKENLVALLYPEDISAVMV